MNKQVAQNIITICTEFDNIKIDSLVEKTFPDRVDIENIQLSQISLFEFVSLSKRVFSQFKSTLVDREISMILPLVYIHPQYGSAQVDGQLQNFISYLNQGNFNTAEGFLLWLVGYQVENGIYAKIQKRQSDSLSSSLNTLSEKLHLIELSIINRQNDVEKSYLNLENTTREIQNLIIQKKDELAQITSNLSTSNTQIAQISEILTRGSEQGARLSTILEHQEKNSVQAEVKIKEFQELYTVSNTKIDERFKVVESIIIDFTNQVNENQKHLEFVEGKRHFFEERNNYLNDLIGREVGASLFETFKQRKNELYKPVIFWLCGVLIMTLATVFWVYFLFFHQIDIKDINVWWQTFSVNTLKTIPAIFLLFFSINQYRNERNFQEEYAFKSAVALTIDAFSSRLKDENNKDKLIMESVLNLYQTPIKEKHEDHIKSKNLLETLKNMIDATRELIKGKN
jgi:hypothetical protein